MKMKKIVSLAVALVSGVVLLNGCIFDTKVVVAPLDNSHASRVLFVATNNYVNGQLNWMNDTSSSYASNSLTIGADVRLKNVGGYLYALEGFGTDNILKIDPNKGDSVLGQQSVVYEKSLADNCNPLDIEVINATKAFVATENVPYVLIVNPETGDSTGRISTAAYCYNPTPTSATPSPYATALTQYGDTVYVLMNHRTTDSPALYGPGLIVLINKNSNTIIDTITLAYTNPTSMVLRNNLLYVTSCGSYDALNDGAVEVLNLTNRQHLPNAISKSTLGGRPEHIVCKGGTSWYVETYVAWGDVRVVEANFFTGTVVATLSGITNAYGGICYDSVIQRLYVGEQGTSKGGLLVFDAATNQKIGSTITNTAGLNPGSMAIVERK